MASVWMAAAVAHCDRSDRAATRPPEVESAGEHAQPASPLETVAAVHRWRLTGRLAQVESRVVPDQRIAVRELLLAVDRLAAADRALRDAISQQLGTATADAFDYSQVANIVGVFSRDVSILSEHVSGDTATVTIQVADRLPLDEVALDRQDGRWLIRTDPPIPELATELTRLADVLSSVARSVSDHRWTIEQLRRELDVQTGAIRRRICERTAVKTRKHD